VNSSITRYRQNVAVGHLMLTSRAVEAGLIAAGATVCFLAAVQTFSTVLSWMVGL
jgi:hypothetical protein